MSVKPSPLRKQESQGIIGIPDPIRIKWDDADLLFAALGYGLHEIQAEYVDVLGTGGLDGLCKVSGTRISTSATGVSKIDEDADFNGHASLEFSGVAGVGLQFDRKDVVGSFTIIIVIAGDAAMYYPALAAFRYVVAVYDKNTDTYNWRFTTRNVGSVTRQQFVVGSSSLNTNTVQSVPAAETAQIWVVSHDDVGHTSRISINDLSTFSDASHTDLAVSADDQWVIGGGVNDNTGVTFAGRMTNAIVIDEAVHLDPAKWLALKAHVDLLKVRYGIA